MTTKTLATIALVAALGASATPTVTQAQSSRDYIAVVGSSTVYPFTTTVAEQFGKPGGKFKTPKVESTGTGGGIKLFCNGVGVQHPDISNASRAHEGQRSGDLREERRDRHHRGEGRLRRHRAPSEEGPLYKADAQARCTSRSPSSARSGQPDRAGAQPLQDLEGVNKALPAIKIEVLGPRRPPARATPSSSWYMEEGCRSFRGSRRCKGVDEKRFKRICDTVREDGAFVEAGENDNLIVQKLEANPKALGIFGFSFLEENVSQLRGLLIDGVEPTFETIASGKYPVSRPLFIYVKKAHIGVIPGLKEFVDEYVSDKALDGHRGLPGRQGPDPAVARRGRQGPRRHAGQGQVIHNDSSQREHA
jgi:phosphate transport system substrate-binding protein